MFHLRYDHQTEENPHVAVFAEQKSDGQEAAYSRSGCAFLHGFVNQINVVQLKVVYAFGDLSFCYWIKSSLSGD